MQTWWAYFYTTATIWWIWSTLCIQEWWEMWAYIMCMLCDWSAMVLFLQHGTSCPATSAVAYLCNRGRALWAALSQRFTSFVSTTVTTNTSHDFDSATVHGLSSYLLPHNRHEQNNQLNSTWVNKLEPMQLLLINITFRCSSNWAWWRMQRGLCHSGKTHLDRGHAGMH